MCKLLVMLVMVVEWDVSSVGYGCWWKCHVWSLLDIMTGCQDVRMSGCQDPWDSCNVPYA